MTKLVFLLFVVVVCVFAEHFPLSDFICSAYAEGYAYFTGDDDKLYVKMSRVENFVRYDFFVVGGGSFVGDIVRSIVVRPDLGYTFYYNSEDDSCVSSSSVALLQEYKYSHSIGTSDLFENEDCQFFITQGNLHRLVREVFYNNEIDVNITIDYISNEDSFSHNDNDGLFVLDMPSCSEAREDVFFALTSVLCGSRMKKNVEIPECAYKLSVWNDTYSAVVEFVNTSQSYGRGIERIITDDLDTIAICNDPEQNPCRVVQHGTECTVSYESYSFFLQSSFEYDGIIDRVACPNGYGECQLFFTVDHDKCSSKAFIDSEGRYAAVGNLNIRYDGTPSFADFEAPLCDSTVVQLHMCCLSCGLDLSWDLKDNGNLIISGRGLMYDFDGRPPWDCSSVKMVEILEGVESIGEYAFYNCSNLNTVFLPSTLQHIWNYAFASSGVRTFPMDGNCSGLADVGEYAFADCQGLKWVTILGGVRHIGIGAFSSCSNLLGFDVSPENSFFNSENGVLFDYSYQTLIQYPAGNRNTLSYVIPDSVSTIGSSAFAGCCLDEVSIPDSVIYIGDYCFKGSSLARVYYQGFHDFYGFSGIFESCSFLKEICVRPEYPGDTFCEKEVNVCRSDSSNVVSHSSSNVVSYSSISSKVVSHSSTSSSVVSHSLVSRFSSSSSHGQTTNDWLWLYIVLPVALVLLIFLIIVFATPVRHKIFGACHSDDSHYVQEGNQNESQDSKVDDGLTVFIEGENKKLTLKKPIGKGAFGTVWLAEAGTLQLAAKEMLKEAQLDDSDFTKEMEIMSQLHSQFVVRVYGSTANTTSLFIIMEYIPLGSLSSAIASYEFSPYMRCRFMFDVARGMEYLHSQGVVHRDLKPGNVLVCSFDPKAEVLCKITDFGESRKGLEQTRTMTMTRGVGTPYYMAPEMMRGDKKYTRAVDVYSFSILCVEVWNEELPYSEVELDTPFAFALHVMEGHRPQIKKDCPRKLKKLIERCWDPDRLKRPPFTDVVNDCAHIIEKMDKSSETVHMKERTLEQKTRTVKKFECEEEEEEEEDIPKSNPSDPNVDLRGSPHKHKSKSHKSESGKKPHKSKTHKSKSHKSGNATAEDEVGTDEVPLDDLSPQQTTTTV